MKTKRPTPAKTKLENKILKKMCYILVLFSGMAFGQIVNIPDANFKALLLSANISNSIACDINNNAFRIDANSDGEIETYEVLPIYYLHVQYSNIADLTGISAFKNLLVLDCNNNQLTSLDVSNLLWLGSLNCAGNHLTSLITGNLTNLIYLYCDQNQLSSINISNFTYLQQFYCSSNQLTNLDISNNMSLTDLDCSNNLLNNIDLSNLNSIHTLQCDHNHLTQLDISNLHSLNTCKASNNQLTKVFLKNGYNYYISDYVATISDSYNFTNNPNLNYVCADDNKIAQWIYNFNINGMPNVVVNSYCSFATGGNYNTINGQIKFDANNNGCDSGDLPQPNIRVNINDGTNTGATFTTNTGNYTFYTQAGSFDLTPDTENPTWFTFSPPTATIPFADNNNNSTTQNFCIAANGVHNDVEVVVEPILYANAGFDATYKIVYNNKGNQMLSGDVSFTYDDSVLDFISATLVPTSLSTGLLNWSYTNLLPFENRSFYITLHVNASSATPPVNMGDNLSFNAIITPIISDENPLDNTFTFNQTVVGSFDPNAITCMEGYSLSPTEIGNYLHYGVIFENTGNYQAQNVVVKDIIDTTKYDINSIQLLNTSHPAYTRITGNIVEFIFENINLAASSGTPPVGGHGDVLFKIKSLNSLVAGDFVEKSANIYFDYNAPIDTNVAQTTYQLLSNSIHQLDSSVIVSPNPTSSFIKINCNSTIKSVELYDVQGRILETSLKNNSTAKFDISEKQNGIYFLKITTENGSKVEKIVKE